MLWLLAPIAAHAAADCHVERVSPARYEVTVSGDLLGSGVLVKREDGQLLGGRWYRESLCLLVLAESWLAAAEALREASQIEAALLAADEGIATLGVARMRPPRSIDLAMRTHHRLTPGDDLPTITASRLTHLRDSIDRYAEATSASGPVVRAAHVPQPPAPTPTPTSADTLLLW